MPVAVAFPSQSHFYTGSNDDLQILDMLTSGPLPNMTASLFHPNAPNPKQHHKRRDAPLDPLLLAATAASGPHVTRHHFHHGFQPGLDGFWSWTGDQADQQETSPKKPIYTSKQAPRRQRLAKENDVLPLSQCTKNLPSSKRLRSSSNSNASNNTTSLSVPRTSTISSPPKPLEVKCMARTRIPTPHGEAFLHLYHNNRDSKEHLAIVVDPSQLSPSSSSAPTRPIRSKTLDAVWSDTETERDRLVRGAYVGRLSQTLQSPSLAITSAPSSDSQSLSSSIHIPYPLVRIHSECFTGETIGSQRCDCGEQLDEALRLIFKPITITSSENNSTLTVPGRGAVVYLRQEGRGIGLLSKIRAYNLQDMGHDTVTANLLLGHEADERAYDVACAILRDLGLNPSVEDALTTTEDSGLRLLTNNPDKVRALEEAGVRIAERVPMVPRSWTCKQHDEDDVHHHEDSNGNVQDSSVRAKGATMIGSGATESPELEKYLRTKVERMGHMLQLPEKLKSN